MKDPWMEETALHIRRYQSIFEEGFRPKMHKSIVVACGIILLKINAITRAIFYQLWNHSLATDAIWHLVNLENAASNNGTRYSNHKTKRLCCALSKIKSWISTNQFFEVRFIGSDKPICQISVIWICSKYYW